MTNRENCVKWIKDYFANNKDGKAIIGIPITIDSSCCAGVTPAKHEAALEAMRSCQIDVI